MTPGPLFEKRKGNVLTTLILNATYYISNLWQTNLLGYFPHEKTV